MTALICNNPSEITGYFQLFMTDVTALTLLCFVATPPISIKLSVSHCFDILTSCSALLPVPQSPAQVCYSAPVENELKMPPQLHSLCFSGLVQLDCLQVQE